MSLVGHRSQNHPQQVGTRGPLDEVDDRGTLPEYFSTFDLTFGPFTLDVAAAAHNAKCDRYFTRADDGLAQSWAGERVWCNPPYSNLAAWLRKAWAELDGTRKIVMLLPANRCEQGWWQEHVEPYRDRPDGTLSVMFLPGRMRFVRPDVTVGPKGDRPPFGCCLLVFTPRDASVTYAESGPSTAIADMTAPMTTPDFRKPEPQIAGQFDIFGAAS